jgi:hypothetical protein
MKVTGHLPVDEHCQQHKHKAQQLRLKMAVLKLSEVDDNLAVTTKNAVFWDVTPYGSC